MQDRRILKLGKAIRRSRKELGLSQEALANRAELDRAYVGKIERGEKNITIAKLLELTDALGLKVKDVIDF